MIDRKLVDKVREWFDDPAGWCYVASEAIYYASGGKAAGITPMQATLEWQGMHVSHWWLRDEDLSIVDATADQFPFTFPYHLGKGRGFMPKMKADTVELLEWLHDSSVE